MSPTSNIHPLSSQHLRVGFDAKRAFNNSTGLGNYSRFVIHGLSKFFPQHELFLFTPSVKKEYEQIFAQNANVKLVTPESFWGKKFSALWRTYSIAEMCNELRLDVFHGLSNELPVGIEKFDGKKIVTIHDLIFLRYPAYYNNIDRFIYTRKFKRSCREANLILAASQQTRNDIVSYFGTSLGKIAVTYQNCDERYAIQISETDKQRIIQTYSLPEQYILCVGTIEQRKHQLTVLKAFHKLVSPQLKLVFVGKQTDYAEQLHEFIATHNLSNQIVFLQQIPIDDLPGIYQLAKVCVYASEFEGFGIPVLEGMRSRIPVIAARASSLPEVGGNVIRYFQPGNETELTTQLNAALQQGFSADMYAPQLAQFNTGILIHQLESLYH